jgi:hydrophobe/amphiphile efflux-1 (HAE1) family protein/NodT family efflux transporter outer membrane factor (OMF) lipoprotein
MLYFFSKSSNDGVLTIDVTFELGTDIDLATVKTQNKVNVALPALPPEVQRVGVTVKKVSSAFLMAIAVSSTDDRYDSLFLSNYSTINLVDRIGSLPGVGDARLAATEDYGMRVWINPDKMAKLGLTATDISRAIQSQNRQNPAGTLGQAPTPAGTDYQYPVTAAGRLLDPSQFSDIILRAQPDSSLLRLRDVGRVELGAQDYKSFSRISKKPAALIIVYLSPGANAVDTANRVHALLDDAKKSFPPGIDYKIGYDATKFVRAAITEVRDTLFIAIALVIFVVFIFLQNWRATLIPLLTVPVAIIGTFALFPLLGFSINMTSMFGLVLAIGIVVDDAIVVVEAVQHKIDHGMTPREATIQAMEEVSGPVVAIALILSAVFIPVSFLGGISGQIYRQFALTIATSVLISAFSALSLSPALSAMILRPAKTTRGPLGIFFGWFNKAFEWSTRRYLAGVRTFIRRAAFAVIALGAFYLAVGGLFKAAPGGFLPDEDQGVVFVVVRLPDGASLERNDKVTAEAESAVLGIPGVEDTVVFGGLDITTRTNSSNVSTIIAVLKPWEERKSQELQFASILRGINMRVSRVQGAFAFAFGLPPILGLGTSGGFEFMVEDRTGGDVNKLANAAQSVVAAAQKDHALGQVANIFRVAVPSYQVKLDNEKTQTLGIPTTDVYDGLQTFLGGLYINDFNRFGRTWRVIMQAEPEYRQTPDAVNRFYVRTANNDMVPLSTLVTMNPTNGPDVVYRFNRYRAAELIGQTAPGFSSGQSAAAIEQIAKANLPAGFDYEWSGTVFQQKLSEGKEGFIFGFAAVLVFLFLAAQYESWTIPFAVVLAVPLGLFGALVGIFLRSYAYDVYTQIGIVTLIGLASKNAILIVEYARLRHESGMSVVQSALAAARLRLRPIIMTSLAFILGVAPLLVATGAGAASRRALGTAVFAGMTAATLLAVLFVPTLYVVMQKIAEQKLRRIIPAVVTALFLAGCAVGPSYQHPKLETPATFRSADSQASDASLADMRWSELFKDPVLTDLIATALEQNHDVRIAAERVLEARAKLGITGSNLYPALDANALSANGDGGFNQAGFRLGWEIDLWGRVRRLREAARADYLASEDARRGVTTTVVADVTTAYLTLREFDMSLDIARKTRDIGEDSLRLTTLRQQSGAATALDVHQAEQLLRTATAKIAEFERSIAQQENALSVLIGKTPDDIPRGKALDELTPPVQVAAGLSSALLNRRPDIREAEQALIAANAQIGVARTLYFPQISLTGFMGGQSSALANLFSGPSRLYNLDPAAGLPIFNAGKIRSTVKFTEAAQREALVRYEKSVQTAFREVSDALVAYRKNTEQLEQEQLLIGALRESNRLSLVRYQGGLDSYLQVLDAERNLFREELVLAQLRRTQLSAVVELYRALGGGWQ